MRADKRSFSFTWMRGQKNNDGCNNAPSTNSSVASQEQPNGSWFMTTASTSSSSSGFSSMSESSTSVSMKEEDQQGKENTSFSRSDNSKGRLRRLGSSFTRFGTKYSIIEDDDEGQQAAPLEFENQIVMEAEDQEMEQPQQQEPAKEPVHFDEDGNFIGRPGKSSCSRRKSYAANKEGMVAGTSSSFGRKLNKTVQEVKASIGNFSQVKK